MNQDLLQHVGQLLRNAQHLVVLTGAGISAESGVPTFRDALTSHWAKFNPQELASPEGFLKNPELVWRWYVDRRHNLAEARPNPGHRVLAWLADALPQVSLLTQNVDGLHQAAGSPLVHELHGNIWRSKCFRNNHPIHPELAAASPQAPPQCPLCGSLARPDVVWFGELLPADVLTMANHASRQAELFLVVGTSGQVQPAASLGYEAMMAGAKVVVINPDPHAAIAGATFLKGPSGEILPKLIQAGWGINPSEFQ